MGKKSIRGVTQQIVEAIDTGGFSVIKNQKGEQQREYQQIVIGEDCTQQQGVINGISDKERKGVKQ